MTDSPIKWRIEAEREYGRICRQGTRSIVPHLPYLRATVQVLDPRSILELGTGRSHSTLAMYLGASPGTTFQTVDLVKRGTQCRTLLQGKVDYITDNIWNVCDKLDDPELLFIDDDHTYEQVTRELQEFAPRTKRCIIFHDTHLVRHDADAGRAYRDFMKTNGKDWALYWDCDYPPGITAIIRR